MRIVLMMLCAAAACLFAPVAGFSQSLPTVETLPCVGNCVDITGPVPVDEPKPIYPSEYVNRDVEGYVNLQYIIGMDGHVSDMTITELVGPRKLADITAEAVKQWTYKPAMSGGKAVEMAHRLHMAFAIISGEHGARPVIAAAYDSAAIMIRAGKLDDAFARLKIANEQPELNLYERTMIANLMAEIAYQQKRFLDARKLSEGSGGYGLNLVPVAIARNLWHLRIVSDLYLGDLSDALASLQCLKEKSWITPADSIVAAVEKAKTKADALPVFFAQGRIPPESESDVFSFALYRRNFAFSDISGKLDRYTMNCKQRAVRSEITDQAKWHVPTSWSGCVLAIHGTPGTTFNIAQYDQ